jgi:segregation and condensation protein A
MAELTRQYLGYVEMMRRTHLELAAEYLLMAAVLIEIKSRLLLPRPPAAPGAEADDPRAELVRRLLEYQQMREVVDVLERRGEERRNQFARSYLPQQAAPPQAPLALSLSELLSAVDRVLRTVTQPNMHEIIPRALDVPGAIMTIRSVLTLKARIMWTELVETAAEPWQILSTLLGLLELAKLGELRVAQPKPFGNVEISRDVASEAA